MGAHAGQKADPDAGTHRTEAKAPRLLLRPEPRLLLRPERCLQFLPNTAQRSKALRCWNPAPREEEDPGLSSITFSIHRPGP